MNIESLKDTYKLRNEVKIPCVGFGTYLTPDGDTAVRAVREAIEAGYRHIDTAAIYKNEGSVGKAIRESGIKREDLFVTSKLWNSDQGYESTKKAFEKTMDELQMEYLDLYLIHWPIPKGHDNDWEKLNQETWRAMEELYETDRIHAIGVSNFSPKHLKPLMEWAQVMPMVNQIEIHPGLNQEETVDFCKENNIIVEAWGPFSQGKIFSTNVLEKMAQKYNKTIAQICLRWHLQRGILPLPKSVTPSRIIENTQIFDFNLNEEDMDYISHIEPYRTGPDPDTFRA